MKIARKSFLYLISAYQKLISPFLGHRCRFTPTCSQYLYKAVSRYGILQGSFLGGKRLLRCHPWSKGGYDPVP